MNGIELGRNVLFYRKMLSNGSSLVMLGRRGIVQKANF
jgi:hypothetical protein